MAGINQLDRDGKTLEQLAAEVNAAAIKSNAPQLDAATLSRLDDMPKDALISLIRRVSGAMWGVGLMDDKQIVEAFKLKLAIGGMAEKDMFKALPVMREWFDRTLGKAPQSVALTVKDEGLSKVSTEKLLRLAAMLDEPMVIPPEPKRLADDHQD